MQGRTDRSGSVEKQVGELCASCCVPKFSAKSSERIYLQNLYLLFLLTLILSQFCSCTFAPVCSQASVLMIIHPALGVMQRMRDALDSSSLSCVSQQRFGVCFAWWAGWRGKGVCSFAALLMSSSQDTVWFCAAHSSCVVCAAPLPERSFPGWAGDAPS